MGSVELIVLQRSEAEGFAGLGGIVTRELVTRDGDELGLSFHGRKITDSLTRKKPRQHEAGGVTGSREDAIN
jgi:hypothetical protein